MSDDKMYQAKEDFLPTGEARKELIDKIMTPPNTNVNQPFEIPRDENGKIDISKLPEEIRDAMELVSTLFSESTTESEAILEQMIKVAQMNAGNFPEFPFDLPLIHERERQLLGPDRAKAEMFGFSRPLRHQAIVNALQSSGQHHGVLSSMSGDNTSENTYKNMPNKSVGESEYIRPEDRAVLLSGYSPEEQMGLKLPDDLAAMLSKPLPEGKIPFSEEVIPTGFGHLNKMIEGGVRREDLVVMGSGNTTPSRFGPVFEAATARRHLYKSLLERMNKEIAEGPLAGIVFFTGVTSGLPSISPTQFVFSITWTHKARNRMKAFNTYFTNLRVKYMLEIKEAEAKVMERE